MCRGFHSIYLHTSLIYIPIYPYKLLKSLYSNQPSNCTYFTPNYTLLPYPLYNINAPCCFGAVGTVLLDSYTIPAQQVLSYSCTMSITEHTHSHKGAGHQLTGALFIHIAQHEAKGYIGPWCK